MKILILKPSSLGDVVQALPVLRLLRQHWPHSSVHWWIDSGLAPLLEGDPDLAGVVRFERRRWASPRHWPEVWRSIQWLREQRFELVIDLQCLARSGAFAWLTNGDLLVGLDESREGARGYYDIAVRRPSYHTHAVEWYLEVLRALRVPVHFDFDWIPQRPEVAARIRQRWRTTESRWILLQPGARWLNKRWPAEYFAATIRALAVDRPDCRFAVLGNEADRELGAVLAAVDKTRCVDLTGQLSLNEMVEWIRIGDFMISNDTGPMHVAAALRKPVLGIFGPTEPRRTGPFGQIEDVLQADLHCVPCMSPTCSNPDPLACLRTLTPPRVVSLVAKRLRC